MPGDDHNEEGDQRRDEKDNAEHAEKKSRHGNDSMPVEQHPNRNEEEDGENVAHWQDIGAGLVAHL